MVFRARSVDDAQRREAKLRKKLEDFGIKCEPTTQPETVGDWQRHVRLLEALDRATRSPEVTGDTLGNGRYGKRHIALMSDTFRAWGLDLHKIENIISDEMMSAVLDAFLAELASSKMVIVKD